MADAVVHQYQLLHADPGLRITFQPGQDRALVVNFVTFGTHQRGWEIPDVGMPDQLSEAGQHNVLHIKDMTGSYYTHPGQIQTIVETLSALQKEHRFEKLVSFGNSMGGYGAILFNRWVPFDATIAGTPPIDLGLLARRIDPRCDRIMWNVHPQAEGTSILGTASSCKRLFLFYPLNTPDAAHAAMFPVNETTHNFAFPTGGHAIFGPMLKDFGVGALVRRVLADDPAAVARLVAQYGGFDRSKGPDATLIERLTAAPALDQVAPTESAEEIAFKRAQTGSTV